MTGGFFACHMLLPVFLDQRVSKLAVEVVNSSNQAPRQIPLERLGASNDANVRTTGTQRQAQGLPLTHHNVRAERARRFQPSTEQRIDTNTQ